MPWAADWWGPGGVPTGRMGRKFAITAAVRGRLTVVRRKTEPHVFVCGRAGFFFRLAAGSRQAAGTRVAEDFSF